HYLPQAGGRRPGPHLGPLNERPRAHGQEPAGGRRRVAVEWAPGVTYGRVRKEEEYQLSRYSFELADVDLHRRVFEDALKEGRRLLEVAGSRAVLPAYVCVLKASHAFNVLDARGAISASHRAAMILCIRTMICAI